MTLVLWEFDELGDLVQQGHVIKTKDFRWSCGNGKSSVTFSSGLCQMAVNIINEVSLHVSFKDSRGNNSISVISVISAYRPDDEPACGLPVW